MMVRARVGLMSPRKVGGGGRRRRRVVATLALVAMAYGVASLIASAGGDDDDWATDEREANVGLRSRLRASADRFARVGGGDRGTGFFRGVGRADAASSRRAGGYDGTHQGGLANFGDDDDDAREPRRPRAHAHAHDHDHDHDHGAAAALAGTPPRHPFVGGSAGRAASSFGSVDGWNLDPALPRVPAAADDDGSRRAPAIPLREPFPLRDVRLLPDLRDAERAGSNPTGDAHRSRDDVEVDTLSESSLGGLHADAAETNARYLLDVLDHRRLLANFRDVAKLRREKGVRPYCDAGTPDSYSNAPGACWEAPDCELRGHFVGHYLSAVSFLAASATARPSSDDGSSASDGGSYSSSVAARASAVVDAMVSTLAAAQASSSTSPGYVSAFPESVLDRQAKVGGVWAPYYTLHKIGQGLLDAHVHAGHPRALDVLVSLLDHVLGRAESVVRSEGSDFWFKRALHYPVAGFGAESGGMNELAWRAYAATGESRLARLASLFDHPTFLGAMRADDAAARSDWFTREHANFHEPLAVGAAARHEITGDVDARLAAERFLETLRDTRAFATAGSCDGERWHPPRRLESSVRSAETQETCTQVNLEILAARALAWSSPRRAAEWADYAERAALHGAMSAQRGPGELLYTTPLGLGVSKGRSGHGWGDPERAFWCCYGTAVEALARLQHGVFWRARAGTPEPGEASERESASMETRAADARPDRDSVPGSTHAHDTVYVARAVTSAAARWPEIGVEIRARADPFARRVGASPSRGAVYRDGVIEGVLETLKARKEARRRDATPCDACAPPEDGYAAVLRVDVVRSGSGTSGSSGSAGSSSSGEGSGAGGAATKKKVSVRLRVPAWSRGVTAAPEITVAGRPAREPGCRGEAPGWCDATREWRASKPPDSNSDANPGASDSGSSGSGASRAKQADSRRERASSGGGGSSESDDASTIVARFPLVVRAEPLLGSGDPAAAAEGTSKTGPNQPGEGVGARHAIVAGPFVLAAVGPGAWVGDLGVAPPKKKNAESGSRSNSNSNSNSNSESNSRASRSESGGFHDGAGEVTDGVWALSRRAPRRVAFRLAADGASPRSNAGSESESKSTSKKSTSSSSSSSFASVFGVRGRRAVAGPRAPRYLGAIAERADGGLAADGVASDGTVEPYVGAAAVVVEPSLRPSADGAPGGSGYFYAQPACDARSCANVMADAVAVTWNLIPVEGKGIAHANGDGDGDERASRAGAGARDSSDADALFASDDSDSDADSDDAFLGSSFSAFALEPMGAPGLRLAAAGGGRRGRADAVVLTAAPDARRLTLRHDPASRRLVVVKTADDDENDASSSDSDSLAGRVLCADASAARDFPGAGGCADLDEKCAEWARGGECVANQGFMHGSCPASCGTCRPAGVRLETPERAADEACAFDAVTDDDDKVDEVEDDFFGKVGGLSGASDGTGTERARADSDSDADGALLPARPARGSFVAAGPDATRLPYVLLSPLALLRDEVYTVYLRLRGGAEGSE